MHDFNSIIDSYNSREINFLHKVCKSEYISTHSLWDHCYADFEACLATCGVAFPFHFEVPRENIANCLYHCQRIEEPIPCDIILGAFQSDVVCDAYPLYVGPGEAGSLGTLGEQICMECFELKLSFGSIDFHDPLCAEHHRWLPEMPYVYHFTDSGMVVWERDYLNTKRIDRTKLVRLGSPVPLIADGRICMYSDEDQRYIDKHKEEARRKAERNNRGKWHGSELKNFLYDD